MKSKNFFTLLWCVLSLGITPNVTAQLRIMPLGNSITYDNNMGDVRPVSDRIAYRKRLYDLLVGAGYNIDFVGSENAGEPTIADGDNAGFPGINVVQLESLLATGIINQSPGSPLNYNNDDMVTSGPYLDAFNPDVILLHIGTNDVGSTTATDVANVLDEIDAYEGRVGKNVPVFIAKIIREVPNNPATQTLNNAVQTMVNTRIGNGDNLILVNMETGASINYAVEPAGDMADQLHPSNDGYTKMGDLWFSEFNNVFKVPVINSSPVLTAIFGQTYTYDVNVSAGNPAPVFSFGTTPPTGMMINASSGLISWNPTIGQVGTHSIMVQATNDLGTDMQSFDIEVSVSNSAPTFTKGPDQIVDEDAGLQQIPNWATDIDDGDAELTQSLTFIVIDNSNPDLFLTGPSVDPSGLLSFESAENANGQANITLVLQDDGGNTPPNENTSFQKVFTITVSAVNDPPMATGIMDSSIEKNTSLGPIEFTINDVESDPATLSVTAYSNNQVLIEDSDIVVTGNTELRSYSLTPNPDQVGQALISLEISDGESSSTVDFMLTVTNVTGLEDDQLDNRISVFPNPHNDFLYIDIQDLNSENIEISFYSITGKKTHQSNFSTTHSGTKVEINTAGMEAGIYFLHIADKKKIFKTRIIKTN